MIVSEIRRLAEKHSLEELQSAADEFEKSRQNLLQVKGKDDGEIMSNYLAAAFVREQMNQGLSLNEAVRQYSARVRSILSPGR